ncbi:hypothetical protein NDU88_005538 [Pleurodeles waltl]|uniref:Uncharacterized protein n=1 Tax=Pleurodeles waltl TaxID=8319 RepID=A0AAV7MWS1_PLEWA|nr:hypothetical protein NDU88_005538 [Pleurodeles waltl]
MFASSAAQAPAATQRPGPLQLLSGPRPTSARAPPRIGGTRKTRVRKGSAGRVFGCPGGPQGRGLLGPGPPRARQAQPRGQRQGLEPTEERFGTAAGQVPAVGHGGTEPRGGHKQGGDMWPRSPLAGGGRMWPEGTRRGPPVSCEGAGGVSLVSRGF